MRETDFDPLGEEQLPFDQQHPVFRVEVDSEDTEMEEECREWETGENLVEDMEDKGELDLVYCSDEKQTQGQSRRIHPRL